MSAMSHWSSFIKTIFSLVSKNSPADVERIVHVPLLSLKRALRSTSAGEFFKTNAKMVLINNYQWIITHLMLDVWLFQKKFNHPSAQQSCSLEAWNFVCFTLHSSGVLEPKWDQLIQLFQKVLAHPNIQCSS